MRPYFTLLFLASSVLISCRGNSKEGLVSLDESGQLAGRDLVDFDALIELIRQHPGRDAHQHVDAVEEESKGVRSQLIPDGTKSDEPLEGPAEQKRKPNPSPAASLSGEYSSALRLEKTVETTDTNFERDTIFIAVVSGLGALALVALVVAAVCAYRVRNRSKAAAKVDYPAYGVTGPQKSSPTVQGDRKLAQSAQMYHYQHKKQQMMSLDSQMDPPVPVPGHESESEGEDCEDGEYTVYECPGLAPAGEMEVRNPLFLEPPGGKQ